MSLELPGLQKKNSNNFLQRNKNQAILTPGLTYQKMRRVLKGNVRKNSMQSA
jgi:hypothetical protein